MSREIDPVCGMEVDAGTAAQSTYHSRTYYFCSDTCLRTFQEDPERHEPPVYGNQAHGGAEVWGRREWRVGERADAREARPVVSRTATRSAADFIPPRPTLEQASRGRGRVPGLRSLAEFDPDRLR